MTIDSERDSARSSPHASPWNGARLLDATELAELLNVNRRWVEDATRRGEIPRVPLGRFYRYRVSAIEAWLAELEQPSG